MQRWSEPSDTPLNQLAQSEIVQDGLITHQRERLLHAMLAIGDQAVQALVTDFYGMMLRRRHRLGSDPITGGTYYYTNEDFYLETQQLLDSPSYQGLEDKQAQACLAWCIESWRQYYGATDENQ